MNLCHLRPGSCLVFVFVSYTATLLTLTTEVGSAISFNMNSRTSSRYIGSGYYYSSYRAVTIRSSYTNSRPYQIYQSSYGGSTGYTFRKSDYTLPNGLLQRMGGISSPRKESLLLAGAVYVAVKMRPKFSPVGDYGFKYNLNTYDEIAVCENNGSANSFGNATAINTINMTYFLCPSDGTGFEYKDEDKFCCGSDGFSRCCDEETFYVIYGTKNPVSGVVLVVLAVSGLLCCMFSISGIAVCRYFQSQRGNHAMMVSPHLPPAMMMMQPPLQQQGAAPMVVGYAYSPPPAGVNPTNYNPPPEDSDPKQNPMVGIEPRG